ncbi:MAG: molybdopterin molybdotransferase MoeA [Acidimicrobiales bacterium]
MIALADAQARVLSACPVRPGLATPLAECLGLVTSAPVVARENVPPFANTAMDGFAVRAADTVAAPVELRQAGTLAAGADPTPFEVGPGEAVQIMTGAPIPAGADAIVMVERTSAAASADHVVIDQVATVGDHIRPAAEDIASGQQVFEAGTVLGPGHLGVLASVGLTAAEVHPRLRVGVLSTGDELVDGDSPLGPGQIRDANRRSLLALVQSNQCVAVDLGIVSDDEAAIEAAIDRAVSTCDALITSGGVSMGEFDYVRAVLDRRAEGGMSWMQVAIRPAKPLSFGVVGGVPVFGLPGNPVSSMVSFELFARPALRQMMGHRQPHRPLITGVADAALRRGPDGKTHFARVHANYDDTSGRWRVRESGGQASNLLRAMAQANALAVLADGDGVSEGDPVGLLLFDP